MPQTLESLVVIRNGFLPVIIDNRIEYVARRDGPIQTMH